MEHFKGFENDCRNYAGFPLRLVILENENGHGKVMEKSWNFNIFAFEFYKICAFFVHIKKISISIKGLHFLYRGNANFEQIDGNGKS